jgi:Berberine and berberine like
MVSPDPGRRSKIGGYSCNTCPRHRAAKAAYRGNYERLVALKNKYDPTVFIGYRPMRRYSRRK